jgi:hypothetical protein
MFQIKMYIRLLLLSLSFAQAWSMHNDLPVKLDDLKLLVQNYSKQAVSEAIKKQSPSYLSSTAQFVFDHPKAIGQTLFYGFLITAILGFSASKHYWLTPKGFDASLYKEEEPFVNYLIEKRSLLDLSQSSVSVAYEKNLAGINAGLAAFDEAFGESKKESLNAYAKALSSEQDRRLKLCRKASISRRFIDAGIQNLNVSLGTLQHQVQQSQHDVQNAFFVQEECLQNIDEQTEKEFNKAENEFALSNSEHLHALQQLKSKIDADNEDITQTMLRTELIFKLLGKKLASIDTSDKENQKDIQEALEIIKNHELLIDELEALTGTNDPSSLPGSGE